MKSLIVHENAKVEAIETPIPEPDAGEVLIKVFATASNPKDWKYMLSADDAAGYVHAVGSGVYEFKPGDRVFAFHRIGLPNGAYAEYAVAPATTVAHLPPKISFLEAATVPLAALTASWCLYRLLSLPEPWRPATKATPFLIYGASGAVGSFAVKLARASNIHPIVAVAGRGGDYVKTLIDPSKGDVVLDYRVGPAELQKQMTEALRTVVPDGEEKGLFSVGFDCVAEAETLSFCARVMRQDAKFVNIMPLADETWKSAYRPGINIQASAVTMVNGGMNMELPGSYEFGYAFMRALARGLDAGWLTPHPYEVIPGGLDGVQEGLTKLKAGKASAIKYAYEIVAE